MVQTFLNIHKIWIYDFFLNIIVSPGSAASIKTIPLTLNSYECLCNDILFLSWHCITCFSGFLRVSCVSLCVCGWWYLQAHFPFAATLPFSLTADPAAHWFVCPWLPPPGFACSSYLSAAAAWSFVPGWACSLPKHQERASIWLREFNIGLLWPIFVKKKKRISYLQLLVKAI